MIIKWQLISTFMSPPQSVNEVKDAIKSHCRTQQQFANTLKEAIANVNEHQNVGCDDTKLINVEMLIYLK